MDASGQIRLFDAARQWHNAPSASWDEIRRAVSPHCDWGRKAPVKREWLAPSRRVADFLCVIERGYVSPRTSDGDSIKKLREVEIQRGENGRGCPLFRGQLRPYIEGSLRTTEDQVDVSICIEFRFEILWLAFAGEGKPVLQVIETVVDWSRREHSYLDADALPHDPVHQALTPRIAIFEGSLRLSLHGDGLRVPFAEHLEKSWPV